MPGITGQADTFDVPNYVGELFAVTPTDTPFLSAIGGLTGGERTDATLFQWVGYDLRDADEGRQRLEGADAPTAEARTRFNVTNVVEIHQESVDVSYTKQAATGQYASTGSSHSGSVGIDGSNPVLDELSWQVDRQLEQIARDIERGFIVGTFQNPGNNSTARKTRGILAATETNATDLGTTVGTAVIEADDESFTIAAHGMVAGQAVIVGSLTGGAVGVLRTGDLYYVRDVTTNAFKLARKPGGAAIAFSADGGAAVVKVGALTEDRIVTLLQDVWESGGIRDSETATVMVGGTLKRMLTKIFITDKNFQEQSRNVGGVSLQTFETDFGRLNIMLNRYMPTSTLQVVSMSECSPVFLEIPGKGFLFQEPLAKTGASSKEMIYGEIGLKYGNEKAHGKLLAVGPATPS